MRILIADDEQMLLDLLSTFAESLGHEVTTAEDGGDAMALVHREAFDLALLDVQMPRATGLDILGSLRDKADAPLVVILTGHATVQVAAQSVRDGAFEFLAKPVYLQDLSNTLERAQRVLVLRRENQRYKERLEQLVAERTAELRQANAELSDACEQLTLALDGAKRSSRLAALGELASAIAHEIRNPLSGISLAASNIREEGESPYVRDCAGDIVRSVDHLSRTVDQVLRFARPATPSLKRGSLADVGRQALKMAGTYLRKNDVAVDCDLPDDLPPTYLDASQCEQILVNLLINAARAMPGGGAVSLRAWREGRRICLAVADTGPGIPDEKKEHIFAPFFSETEGGTGLGLSISRTLAESHGGDLRVGDNPGGGAVFTLVLPLFDDQPARSRVEG